MSDARWYAVWPIQGHTASEVPKIALFEVYLLSHLQWELANDHRFLNYETISKFIQAGFVIFVQVFVSRDFELGRNDSCNSRIVIHPISMKFGMYLEGDEW